MLSDQMFDEVRADWFDDDYMFNVIDGWETEVRKLEDTVADQRISIMALEDAISEVWEERVRKLEAVVEALRTRVGLDEALDALGDYDEG